MLIKNISNLPILLKLKQQLLAYPLKTTLALIQGITGLSIVLNTEAVLLFFSAILIMLSSVFIIYSTIRNSAYLFTLSVTLTYCYFVLFFTSLSDFMTQGYWLFYSVILVLYMYFVQLIRAIEEDCYT